MHNCRLFVARVAVATGAVAAALEGCSADDHSPLAAKRTVDARAEPDQAIADAPAATIDRGAPPPPVEDASRPVDADAGDPEPPGPWNLTWLNGLVDEDAVRFCFVPVVGGKEVAGKVALVPPSAGLPFGKSMSFSKLADIDLATTDVHPYLVRGAGDAGNGDGGCASILESQDGAVDEDGALRGPQAISLPLIPAGTLANARSYLAVVTGCARRWPFADPIDASDADDGDSGEAGDGGDGGEAGDARDESDVFRPPVREAICGATNRAPNVGLVLVQLSRVEVRPKLGFQAVHASTASPTTSIVLERSPGGAEIFTGSVSPGQIAPRTAPAAVDRGDFGASLGAASVRVPAPGAAPPLQTPFSATLMASDLDESAIADGDRFSLVLIGAQPGQDPGPPWHAARVAIVRNDRVEQRD